MRNIRRLVQHSKAMAFFRRPGCLPWHESSGTLAAEARAKTGGAPSLLLVAAQSMVLLKMAMKLAFAREAFSTAGVPPALMHCGTFEVLALRHIRY